MNSGSAGFVSAAAVMAKQNDGSAYVSAYCKLFRTQVGDLGDPYLYERLVADLPTLFKNISLPSTFEGAVHHTRLMFADKARALVRRGYLVAMRLLWSEGAADLDLFNGSALRSRCRCRYRRTP